ncbi:MAG: M56 family metallopeptidase, partial [Planctomycetota bacterium]
MVDQINHAGELWWSWMWPMFWQVGVLIGLVAVIDLLLRRRVWPQVRYALWLLVLAKLILPPTFSLSTSVTSGLEPIARQMMSVSVESEPPQQSMQTTLPYIDVSSVPAVIPRHSVQAEPSQSVVASEAAAPAVKTAKVSPKGWAMCVWLLGVAALSVWLAARFRQLRRSHAAEGDGLAVPDWLSESVAESAKKLKLRRLPRVVVSKDIASPAVFGILRPTLLLPSRHLAKNLRKDTEHVLLHELAHIKRGDLWVHAVYMVLQIIHWFNPLLWFVRRRLQHLRELCCDASVAWILREQTRGYRQTILDTAKRLLARPIEPGIGLLGLFEDSSRLLIRLKWLEKKTWRYRTLRIIIVMAVIIFMFACVLPMAKTSEAEQSTDSPTSEGVQLFFAVVPNADGSARQPSLTKEQYLKYADYLAEEGPFGRSIRGEGFQWSPIKGNASNFKDLPVSLYEEQAYMLLCAGAEYVMRPEVEGSRVWGLEEVEAHSVNGAPAINILLDDKGGEFLGRFTKANIGNHLAVVIDGWVRMAPTVNAQIRKVATITGDFTAEEVRLLVEDLKKGMPSVKSEGGPEASSQVALEASGRNWASFRGANGSGIFTDANVPDEWDGASGKGILWKSAVPLAGNSSPVVWGDRVFVSGGQGDRLEVYCFDASSGKLLWTGDVPMRKPGITEKFEVMEDTGLAASTMAAGGERIFAIFGSGDLGCFDFSGRRLWTKSLGIPDNTYGHASSLAMYRNLVIVQLDQGDDEDDKSRIIAFDASLGSIVWETKRPVANSWSSPIVTSIGGADAIITCSDPWVIAYAPAGGNELWRARCLEGDIAPSPCHAGGLAFVVEPYSKIVAIRTDGRGDVTKTHIAWSADEPGPDICSPVSNGKFVFLLNSDGLGLCFNAADGKELWQEDIKEEFFASPSLVGDKLYLLTEKGDMIIAEAGPKYKELKRCKLGEGCRASPAFADGKIYIRGLKNLYCIGEDETVSALPRAFEEAIGDKDDESVVSGKSEPGSVVRVKVLDHRGEPVEDATVELQLFAGGDVDDMDNYDARRAQTDANGLCVFEDITSVSGTAGRAFTSEDDGVGGVPYGLHFEFEIEPGKNYDITLGGRGRPVTGRLVPASGNESDIDWSRARADFDLRAAPFSMGFAEYNTKILRAMIKDEGGNFYRKSSVKIQPDGTFRIENVRAAFYMFRVKVPEEPRNDKWNLFREIRIPLMPDGASDKVFNLGDLAIAYGGHTAPRHIDNRFLGSLEFDRDIPVILRAGNYEQPEVVSTKSVRFVKETGAVTAALNVEWIPLVAERWRARLIFTSENGSYLAWDDVFFETSKIIGKYLHPTKETLNFSFSGELDLSRIPRFLITIRPVSEILTGTDRAQAPAAIGAAGREGGLKGDFDELSVKFGGIWMHWQDVRFTIKPDGAVEFSMNQGPNDKTRYTADFKLRREHLTQFGELLKKTNWLTAPGANEQPGYTDATRIDISLTRNDQVQKVWCHDKNPEPYLSLVNFLKQVYKQEYLLNRMTAAGERERSFSFHQLNEQIKYLDDDSEAINPNHVLDINRFIPPSMDVIANPDDNHYEIIKTVLKLFVKLRIEETRERITYLTTAEQKAWPPSGAQHGTDVVRSAAVEALTKLGGQQARLHIRGMAANHASWGWQVNEALVESLLILDRDNCTELLKNMVPKIKRASWGLIRLGPKAMPAILEVLQSRDLRDMGQIYLIRQYIENWDEVDKPIDSRLIKAVQKNLDYRLGSTTTWTEYHREFLRLAGAPELPSKDARQITEDFLDAVKADDQETILAVTSPRQGNWRENLPQLKKLPELQQLRLLEVYADTTENLAQAIAVGPDADDKDSPRVRILLNFNSGAVWRVRNISIDTREISDRMRGRFLENHPNAKPVPAKSVAPSADADTEKPRAVWGEEFRGLRARLQAERVVWKAGEIPSFEARILNQGQSDLAFWPAQYAFEVEVDGRWYMSYPPGYDVPNETVSPGSKSRSITISSGYKWFDKEYRNSRRGPERFRRLTLHPGRHTVRAAYLLSNNSGRVISNSIEIEILPPESPEPMWGEPIAGVQARIRLYASRPSWREDEIPRLTAGIRNNSSNELFARYAQDGCRLEVDGQWYS